GNVFVSDYFNSRIQKFSGAGLYLTQWGSAGSGNGQFRASGVAVDADGNVFVADRMNSRIQKFTNSGVFVSTFGSQGSGDGQFNGLAGIDVAPSGEIYVA